MSEDEPIRCEICEHLSTRGNHCKCLLTKKVIGNVSCQPTWCPLKKKNEGKD